MAAGDLAASVAGFSPALNSDDLRLGFGKIDEAADLAIKYGQLRFTNATQLLAFTTAAKTQRAVDLSSGDEYRLNFANAWQLWSTGWKGFTPSWASGITPGNGTTDSWYRYVDGAIQMHLDFTLGSTSAVTGPIVMNLPVAAADSGFILGQGHVFNSGSNRIYALYPFLLSTTQWQLRYLEVNGTTLTYSQATGTLPGTWASGWKIRTDALYRAY
jgi:hypothetical protein